MVSRLLSGGGQGGGFRKLGEQAAEGRRREGGKQDCKGGENQEKLGKLLPHFIIFCKRNSTKTQEPLMEKAGTMNKRYRKREVQNPPSTPPPTIEAR